MPPTTSKMKDLAAEFRRALALELHLDLTTRLLYSTDASIYQIEPLGVVFPRTPDELQGAVELCAYAGVPLLARGSGTSLAGQAIGQAVILDCSRHLNRLVEIDAEARSASVEPGLLLNALNRAAAQHGLQFGPDPASAERATLGGSLANNASGAHSISYGMAADHLLSAEVALSDGSQATLAPVTLERAAQIAGLAQEASDNPLATSSTALAGERQAGMSVEARLYRAALEIRSQYAGAIRAHWPRTWRRAAGYNLNYLLPWSPSQPPLWGGGDAFLPGEPMPAYPPVAQGWINLAPLLAASEGTLAVLRRVTLRLVPLPKHTILGVLSFESIAAACDITPALLELAPSAVELIPQILIRLARSVPAYAAQLAWIDDLPGGERDPAALLVVEFSGDEPQRLREQALALGQVSQPLLAETAAAQKQVWGVRKVGLGILMSRAGDAKPHPFIEDLTVPVERLGEFIREIDAILDAHGASADVYGHASAGCLHIRPMINLKTARGVADLRAIASAAVELTIRLGGTPSGEHGAGLARSEWLEATFGEQVCSAFRQLKMAADPKELLNPGKVVQLSGDGKPPRLDDKLRYGSDYRAQAWQPVMSFAGSAGLAGAIELCNGAGVCRKAEGVMCPSFQATQDEMHSTRGRANLLRALISGQFPAQNLAERAVYEALELCLACKGCKAECPSSVDMAKLKYEFMAGYYQRHARKGRDYLFAYLDVLAKAGYPFAALTNWILASPAASRVAETWLGISRKRALPRLARRRLQARSPGLARKDGRSGALFLTDVFCEYFEPETGLAALGALQKAGFPAEVLPVIGAGRTLISKGFLDAARRHALRLVEAVHRADPQGSLPVVGVEPSEIYTLRDEYPDLLPGDSRVTGLAQRAYMIDEFLVRPGADGKPRLARLFTNSGVQAASAPHPEPPVYLHGHCYQKAQPPAEDGYPMGVAATQEMLTAAGYSVTVIESGCCGMAGAFGYEAEHYELSMQVGEYSLFPAVRSAASEAIIAASGVSCREQIVHGAQRAARHPITLV